MGITFLSISGKMAARWSSKRRGDCPAEPDRGGENPTGDEEEQRIRLETGEEDDEDDGISSKNDDLFPHTIADMLC